LKKKWIFSHYLNGANSVGTVKLGHRSTVGFFRKAKSAFINRQWLEVCLWTLMFEILLIYNTTCNICDSNAQGECSSLGRDVLNVKRKP